MKIFLIALTLSCLIGYYLPIETKPGINGAECTEESAEDYCDFEFKTYMRR